MSAIESLLVTVDGLSEGAVAALRRSFTSVYVYPRGDVPKHVLAEVEMGFGELDRTRGRYLCIPEAQATYKPAEQRSA